MRLIVGLGNPGKEYNNTRHNAGFMCIDKVADKCGVVIDEKKFNALITTVYNGRKKTILMKPQTFMNNSGEAVIKACEFYKINPKDVLVIHDDLDLPVGKIRIRTKGSAGGQKGMDSIINHLHTQEISRIRIGIDKDSNIPVVDYVLGKIKKEDKELFNEALNNACEAAYDFMTDPIEIVMNKHNK